MTRPVAARGTVIATNSERRALVRLDDGRELLVDHTTRLGRTASGSYVSLPKTPRPVEPNERVVVLFDRHGATAYADADDRWISCLRADYRIALGATVAEVS